MVRWASRVKFWLALVLAVWLPLQLAPWIWRVVWPADPVLIISQQAPTAAQSQKEALLGPAIASAHLFGVVKEAKSAPAVAAPAPKTRLNLILYGVQASDDPARQGAIIGAPGRPADYYRVGEVLPGGATLAAVLDDHVLLDRNGVRESLYFTETRDSGIQVAAARQPAVTPETFLKQAQAELRKNPRQALASVGLAPNENGEGYVYQGNNPMLNAMNMQKGDVIRSVNGYVLGNIEEDQALLQQLYEQGNLQVEIERGGTTFTINYALR